MTNPFNKDYKPVLDLSEALRESRISQTRTAQRQQMLKSDDPHIRQTAQGHLGALSSPRKKK